MRVLLYKGVSLLSRAIQWRTWSDYSHAALEIRPDKIVDAWKGGVRLIGHPFEGHSPQTGVEAFEVLADYSPIRAAEFAFSKLRAPYDYLGVLRFISRRDPKRPNGRWFCSELVFAAFEAAGVRLMRAFGCRIAHNEIAHGCYTGISCGWSWGYHDTITRDNLIVNNRIHHIGLGVLSDMGGIYLLGVQPGTIVRGNHIYEVESAAYGGWGIYPDEGSSHLLIEHNWVHDTQGAAFHIHYGREIVVRDNVFAATRSEGLIKISKAEGHVAANLLHNVLAGPAPALFEGGYAGDLRTAFRSDANLIAFPPRSVPPCRHPADRKDVPRTIPWTAWQSLGQDRHSRVAEVEARLDRRRQTLRFLPSSPALKIGFRPYDWSLCGPRRTAAAGGLSLASGAAR